MRAVGGVDTITVYETVGTGSSPVRPADPFGRRILEGLPVIEARLRERLSCALAMWGAFRTAWAMRNGSHSAVLIALDRLIGEMTLRSDDRVIAIARVKRQFVRRSRA